MAGAVLIVPNYICDLWFLFFAAGSYCYSFIGVISDIVRSKGTKDLRCKVNT